MTEYVEFLVEKHRHHGALLDSNLLLLLFVGVFRPELIGQYKRLNTFALDDYQLLVAIVERFTQVFTTPNILTEVSNLSSGLRDQLRALYFDSFAASLKLLTEEYVASDSAASSSAFRFFGITDAVITLIAQRGPLVITTDLPLYQYLSASGIEALNFNHIRPLGWR